MTYIIGVDPSLTATGYCYDSAWAATVTYPKGCDGDARLSALWEQLENALPVEREPSYAVIEDLPTHGMGAGKTGMAQGVVRLLLREFNIPYTAVTPATLKKFATGKGNASKPDMRMALYQRWKLDLSDDNQVDAWWLHQIGLHRWGRPDVDLPKTHLAALDKVEWR
jgi:Holliday junction resolvasome RuvABC endonuclease subunit